MEQDLEEFIAKLKGIRGRHTELITVYIPAGFNKDNVVKQLDAEKSTADNIKSKNTRKAVMTALEKITRHLKTIDKMPKNGLAVFCGNVSKTEGQEDIQLWSIEPPFPMKTRLYRCDQEFVIEPLEEMTQAKEVYGLVVMDRKEATIGLLEGKQITVLRKMTSGVPGKIRAGGQCLSPDTLVETENGKIKIKDIKAGNKIKALDIAKAKIIFTPCTNKWDKEKDSYIEIITKNKKSIISSPEHLFFIHADYKLIEMEARLILKGAPLLNDQQKDERITKIATRNDKIKLIDIETSAGNFFANGILAHNSSQRFERITEGMAKEFYRRISEAMKECFFENKKLKGILIGGPMPTKEEFMKEGDLVTALKDKVIGLRDLGNTDESGLDELVDLSGDILAQQGIIHEKKLMEKFFYMLAKEPGKTAYGADAVRKALDYGAVELLLISKPMKEKAIKLIEDAERTSAKIEIISVETDEGKQFYNLSGIGAILRYAIA